MSGIGTLQQRTTYLISLTLVKREPVEEDGGQPAKPDAQDKGAGAGVGTGAAGGAGGDQGPGQPSRSQFHQGTTGVVEQEGGGEPEDSEGRSLCSLKDSLPGVGGELTVGSEKFLLPGNLHPPTTVQRVKAPKLQSPEGGVDKEEVEETRRGISEDRPCITSMTRHTPSVPADTGAPGAPDTPIRSSIPVLAGQHPATLLKAHSSAVGRRDTKERSPTSSQSLDRNEGRVQTRSPGPCRASWAESEGRSRARTGRDEAGYQEVGVRAGGRDHPRKDRLKTGSASLPGPVSLVPKPPRKGKSCTLDNSDLNSLTEDLSVGRESQTQQGQAPRASAKDRKMLKFISGIFTKSSSTSSGSSTAPPVYSIQRESSEEEASIANSQEWTLNRSIPDLRLGVLGSLRSGRSALVHRYITGSYLPQEKPDGGTYKKEVLVEGQSHLLLIREEAGPPDAQFSSWVDAIILVFSLENEASFQEVYQLFSQLNTHRSTADIPLIVVGTQDKISSTNPRVIEDVRARKLCVDVHHSVFYETCATYGLNVDRVFAEATQRMVAQRKQAALLASCKSLPNSPSHTGLSTPGSASFPGQTVNGCQSNEYTSSLPSTPVIGHKEPRGGVGGEGGSSGASGSLRNIPRRRTSLFANRRGSDTEKRAADPRGDVASGRAIKQSILWKRSGSSLNKEWKKKYVTLLNNGTLRYHSSFNDYMQNAHGKEIDLLRVTVKVPGKRPPRAVTPAGPPPGANGVVKDGSASSTAGPLSADEGAGALSPQGEKGVQRCPSSLSNKASSVDALEGSANPPFGKDPGQSSPMSDRKRKGRKKSMNQKGDGAVGQAEAKRKMWKLKSFGSLRNINKTEEENADFLIVSSSGQTWHFEAQSLEEREAWVAAIESQILASLQSCESGRNKARRSSQSEAVALQAIRNTKGNNLCVDCEAPNPTWASLNLGALICIECSGIHRNLGTHLSRVRSLDLDDWPGELTQVLAAIGNHMANSIWESCTQGRQKPKPNATREERESWIRAKYEQRVFVAPLPAPGLGLEEESVPAMLLSAVTERDLPSLLLLLAHSSKEQINLQPSGGPSASRTALHAACQLGDVVMTQLLVWYGSDVTARDPQGQTALTLARKTGSKECADILLQHGCPNEVSPTTAATPALSRRSSTASLGRTNSRTNFS